MKDLTLFSTLLLAGSARFKDLMTENLTLVSGMGRVEPGAGYCSTFPHTPVSFPAILLRFSLGYFHTGLNSLSWCHGRLYFVTLHFRDRHSVAYSRFSDSGDDALLKSTRKYECLMCEKNSFRFLFEFVLSQFRGPHCLGVWSRPGAAQLHSVAEIAPAQPNLCVNRPFYRYGGHIELIRFKE